MGCGGRDVLIATLREFPPMTARSAGLALLDFETDIGHSVDAVAFIQPRQHLFCCARAQCVAVNPDSGERWRHVSGEVLIAETDHGDVTRNVESADLCLDEHAMGQNV